MAKVSLNTYSNLMTRIQFTGVILSPFHVPIPSSSCSDSLGSLDMVRIES